MEVNLGISCKNWFYANKIESFSPNFAVFNLSAIFYLKIFSYPIIEFWIPGSAHFDYFKLNLIMGAAFYVR